MRGSHFYEKTDGTSVGDECSCYVVTKIGINHNGLLDNALALSYKEICLISSMF